MRKLTQGVIGTFLLTALLALGLFGVPAAAQNSPGGAFMTAYNYVIGGQWTWRGRTSPWVIEGATDDSYETTITFDEPTSDTTLTFPNGGGSSAAFMLSALTTNDVDAANAVWGVSNGLRFEGATADGFELSVAPTDVGADVTATLPGGGNAAYAVALSTLTTNDVDAANSVWFVTGSAIVFEGATADANEATLTFADPAADGTLTLTVAGQAAGEQLQTNGTGTLTWEAAGSQRAFKNLEGLFSPAEGLAAMLRAPVYRFHYKRPEDVPGQRITTTGDFETQYVGILAEDAPWAMHHDGRILNPVSTFGYTVLAIQALEARIAELEAQITR
jgi:hypothetical protein